MMFTIKSLKTLKYLHLNNFSNPNFNKKGQIHGRNLTYINISNVIGKIKSSYKIASDL